MAVSHITVGAFIFCYRSSLILTLLLKTMELIILCVAALITSLLTFFSGFGLGTILMPVFAIFFPVEIAIALTGVVHFLNNIFKLLLVGIQADKSVVLKFG